MVVVVLVVAVHGEDVVDGDAIGVGNPPLPLPRGDVCMQLFYALDSSIEEFDCVCRCSFANATVEGIVLVGGGIAIIDTYHAVVVVVLVGVAAVPEHIAIAVVLHSLVPNGDVGVGVVVGIGNDFAISCGRSRPYSQTVAESIQCVLHLLQRVGDNTGVVSHSTAEFSQTVQGIIAVGLAAVRAKGVEAGEDIASGVVGVIIIEN